ncbi:hypothetical protein [Methyloglobulus sp.]|uniref:hypothetical protein n=1 Tax=Methyloglobulus sp. TaxID=2518622 RepID=UPI00398979CD
MSGQTALPFAHHFSAFAVFRTAIVNSGILFAWAQKKRVPTLPDSEKRWRTKIQCILPGGATTDSQRIVAVCNIGLVEFSEEGQPMKHTLLNNKAHRIFVEIEMSSGWIRRASPPIFYSCKVFPRVVIRHLAAMVPDHLPHFLHPWRSDGHRSWRITPRPKVNQDEWIACLRG